MSKILLAGLPAKDSDRLQKIFGKVNAPCEVLSTVDAAMERIPANPPALVIVSYEGAMEPIWGMSEVLKTSAPVTAFLAVIPDHKLETAMKVMKAGAYDCVTRPLQMLDVLAASKRAARQKGRALFVGRVEPPKRSLLPIFSAVLGGFLLVLGLLKTYYGPPADQISLASAHLTGLQWEGKNLWVGDWFDSNILCYKLKPGLIKKFRGLETQALYKMADGQPMLLCNTPSAIVTIGTDLKMRSHQRLLGLPSVQTASIPGTRPTGLVWDGKDIWTSDSDGSTLYRFGEDFKVIETIKSIIPNPSGLAYEGQSLWVLGGSPLMLARLEKKEYGYVWRGPYAVRNLMIEDVSPSGMAIAFGRLWLVSGGYPMMVSASMADLTRRVAGWDADKNMRGAG